MNRHVSIHGRRLPLDWRELPAYYEEPLALATEIDRRHYRAFRLGMRAIGSKARIALAAVVTLALFLFCPQISAAGEQTYRVLMIQSFRASLPAAVDWYGGILRGLTTDPNVRIEMDIESPDLSRVSEDSYLHNLFEVYLRKYRGYEPDLIITTYTPALNFALKYGEQLFPGVPIVFCQADHREIADLKLPPHITGVVGIHDVEGTLKLLLKLHPTARQVAIVSGGGGLDRLFGQLAREAMGQHEHIQFNLFEGTPPAELVKEIQNLPVGTPVLFLSYFEDSAGQVHVPRQILESLTAAGTNPVYGIWDTLIGSGVVGGRMATLADDGFAAGAMGLRILKGERPSDIPVTGHTQENLAVFDGRALLRHGLKENQLPDGSRILHRQASFWETNKKQIVVFGTVIVAQALLIMSLFASRWRLRAANRAFKTEHVLRKKSEWVNRKLEQRVSLLGRERSLGTMATSIAHEVSQPLMAIKLYSNAASQRIANDPEPLPKIRALLEKIEQQAGRVGDIIQRIRTLVGLSEPELVSTELAPLLEQASEIIRPEIESKNYQMVLFVPAGLPPVLADPLQIQLVLVNLLKNAESALATSNPGGGGGITIAVSPAGEGELKVAVSDSGPGVPADRVDHLFDPFSAVDKEGGMGLGLSICRAIVEAHGGRIAYVPNTSGGAVFEFTLKIAKV